MIPFLGAIPDTAAGVLAAGRAAYNHAIGEHDFAQDQWIDAGIGLGGAGLHIIGGGTGGAIAAGAKATKVALRASQARKASTAMQRAKDYMKLRRGSGALANTVGVAGAGATSAYGASTYGNDTAIQGNPVEYVVPIIAPRPSESIRPPTAGPRFNPNSTAGSR